MKTILVFADKVFKLSIPEDATITFAPWSPPSKNQAWDKKEQTGTLRIYQGAKTNILACFSGVTGFRDLSMGYSEQIAKEEGATIWKDDEKGYVRESKVARTTEWVDGGALLPAGE